MEKSDTSVPMGVIETLDLTAPEYQQETDQLEQAVIEFVAWLELEATHDQRQLLSSATLFSNFVGLIPEAFLYENEVHLVYDTVQQPKFRERFLVLRLQSHDEYNAHSLINIAAAKRVIEQYRSQISAFFQIDTHAEGQAFGEELIHAFKQASIAEREVMYGLLSGFPLSATLSWHQRANGEHVDFLFSPVDADRLPPYGYSGTRNDYTLDFKTPGYFHFRPHSVQLADGKIRSVPDLVANGLPGFGFRFDPETLQDPEMQLLYARFNFVYRTLGIAEYLEKLTTAEPQEQPVSPSVLRKLVTAVKERMQQRAG